MRRLHDLDDKDRQILALLEEDGRRPNSDIARITGLSAPTVAERIARMRDIGVIKGFTVKVDPARLGYPLSAIVRFQPKFISEAETMELITGLPEVRDCFRITGDCLLLLHVRVADHDRLKNLLAYLYKHGETQTSIILDAEFEQRPIFAGAGCDKS